MKLLVCVTVPALSKSYDVRLPDDMEVRQIIPLIAQTVEYLSEQTYVSSGHEILCYPEQRQTLKGDDTLHQAGVLNGSHLFLM